MEDTNLKTGLDLVTKAVHLDSQGQYFDAVSAYKNGIYYLHLAHANPLFEKDLKITITSKINEYQNRMDVISKFLGTPVNIISSFPSVPNQNNIEQNLSSTSTSVEENQHLQEEYDKILFDRFKKLTVNSQNSTIKKPDTSDDLTSRLTNLIGRDPVYTQNSNQQLIAKMIKKEKNLTEAEQIQIILNQAKDEIRLDIPDNKSHKISEDESSSSCDDSTDSSDSDQPRKKTQIQKRNYVQYTTRKNNKVKKWEEAETKEEREELFMKMKWQEEQEKKRKWQRECTQNQWKFF
eukprot:TRINITY_DN18237_c0_g1_i1.p1 TRINITY_DN18237_c0_g1~~TRINITY_DN18237_c0_g1_i1.p1  ORF type:complete len:292 (-),score=68.29 TRINITY_DN18237_c0_g1_i1:54-929(-)